MYSLLVLVAAVGLAARQALALCVLAALAAVVRESECLCSRGMKCWPHTLLASCLSASAQAVQQERA